MIAELYVDDTEVYDSLPSMEFEKYQKGYLGILNNAYNQSCNAGHKRLGDMSEITAEFPGGSYDEFVEFYNENYNGEERVRESKKRMAENLIKRVRSIGGDVPTDDAIMWAHRYIEHMLVNSYRGFIDEERAIELIAENLDKSWDVADTSLESEGIDGHIGDNSVQVKPESYSSIDINSFDTDWLITYGYSDGRFKIVCRDT